MFSKSLFKQSCKANGLMWSIITVAVCFMLACVMLISGSGSISDTKVAIQDTIVQGEVESQVKARGINYYTLADDGLALFDGAFTQASTAAAASPEFLSVAGSQGIEAAKQYAAGVGYRAGVAKLSEYASGIIAARGYDPASAEAQEIQGILFATLNVMNEDGVTYRFDGFYASLGETPPRYDLASIGTEGHELYREKYVMINCSVFLAGNMIDPANKAALLEKLSDFNITEEKYTSFGFSDYTVLRDLARAAIVDFRANFSYRMENIKDGETVEAIREELLHDITDSLLATLPEEVSQALREIGALDLYGILVGSIFFKMAGLLLPIIYLILTSNALIAGQVDSGSMAYVLSSSVKRRSVTFTQAVFLIGSLFLMFLLTTATSLICFAIVDVETSLTVGKLLFINLGAFLVMFAMSGICFFTSCFFNRTKNSMAIGGGLNMFFLVATMLGLFGSPVIPTIIRMEPLDFFNYVSVISFFDVMSVLDGTWVFLWKLAVLLAIGVAGYIAGAEYFRKKDLPL